MIYKIVAVIGVIFLLIFGLVLYSALTLPAKTLVRLTPVSEQLVLTSQPDTFAQLPVAASVVQFHFETHGRTLTRHSDFVSTMPVVTMSPACNPSVISAEV